MKHPTQRLIDRTQQILSPLSSGVKNSYAGVAPFLNVQKVRITLLDKAVEPEDKQTLALVRFYEHLLLESPVNTRV